MFVPYRRLSAVPIDKTNKRAQLTSSAYTRIARDRANVIGKRATPHGLLSAEMSILRPIVPPDYIGITSISTVSAIIITIDPSATYSVSYHDSSGLINVTDLIVSDTFTAAGLAQNTAYTFRISKAIPLASQEFTISTRNSPPAVEMFQLLSSTPSSLTFGWNNNTVQFTHFILYHRMVGTTNWISEYLTSSSFVLSGLTSDTSYEVYIVGFDSLDRTGDMPHSITTFHTGGGIVGTAPIAGPSNVSAVAGNGTASVSYTGVDSSNSGGSPITRYTVRAYSGGTFANITGFGSSIPITVYGLTNGTAYTFTVFATNAFGDSPQSSFSSPVTPVSPVNAIPSNNIVFLTPMNNADYVTTTNTSAVYSLPAPLNSVSYSATVINTSTASAIDSQNIFTVQVGSIVYVRVYNLTPLTTYSTTLTCFDSSGNYQIRPLANATLLSHDITANPFNDLYLTQPTPKIGTPPTLNTVTPATTTKTDFLYNYLDYDTVTYPLVRLFGKWTNLQSGNLTTTVNGQSGGVSWAFYNNEFKVYVKLFSSGRATYGQTNGLNTVTVSDGSVTKTVHIYYKPPDLSSSATPRVVPYLYDAYAGPGTCDAPPSRTDNTMADNQNRLKMDILLLQSFFAESYKAAREAQEGVFGLPYTTFAVNLDSNDEPVIDMIYETDPTRTRSYLRGIAANGRGELNDSPATGLISLARTAYTNPRTLAMFGGPTYLIGYSLLSHLDPITQVYTGQIGEGSNQIGVMNSANLIWHPKSLSDFQTAWNDTTSLPTTYNQFDNAYTVGDSCARIIGSLMHELTHVIPQHDHPSQMIGLFRDFPGNYVCPFDADVYKIEFGIDQNDATTFRNWVMSYNYDHTPVSHSYSELGTTCRGWWSPYSIHGYVNLYQSILTTTTSGFSRFQITNIDSSTNGFSLTSVVGLSVNDAVIILDDIFLVYSGLVCQGKRVYYIHSIVGSIALLKSNLTDTTAVAVGSKMGTSALNAYLVKSPRPIVYVSALRSGWINSQVLVNHPIKTSSTMAFYTTSQTVSVPNAFNGYLRAELWGAGGQNYTTISGGSGGFVEANIPIKSSDSISLVIGSYTGGGQPNPRSGGPYAGAGGSASILYINGVAVCVAGAGGGAGQTTGRSVYQTLSLSDYEGNDGSIVGGVGADNTQFNDQNLSGCGGSGYLGGTAGKYSGNSSFAQAGGGSGSSFIYPGSGLSIQRGGSIIVTSYNVATTVSASDYFVNDTDITIAFAPSSNITIGSSISVSFSNGSTCYANITSIGYAHFRPWRQTTTYAMHDCVYYSGSYWVLVDYIPGHTGAASSTNETPGVNPRWVPLAYNPAETGYKYFNILGGASTNTNGAFVSYNGALYTAYPGTGNIPAGLTPGGANTPVPWLPAYDLNGILTEYKNSITGTITTGTVGSGDINVNTLANISPSPLKHIIPSVFDSNPAGHGAGGHNGCIGLQFISTDPTVNSFYTSISPPSLSAPPADVLSDAPTVQTLIPRPASITTNSGTCTLSNSSSTIYYSDTTFTEHAALFSSEIANLTGITPAVNSGAIGDPGSSNSIPPIYLYLDSTLTDSDNQYYKFKINIQTGQIKISAQNLVGMCHGTSAVLQLLRINSGVTTLQNVLIQDYATCSNTGLMIDMARDPYEINNVKYMVDLCRFYRMRFIHIHGNDEKNNFGDTDDSGMVFYWNPSGNVVTGDPTTLGNMSYWFRSQSNWNMLVEYARIRGVAFIPEIEMYGRGAGIRSRFPLTFGNTANIELMNMASDACIAAIKTIISQLSSTFYTSPYIFIGSDEAVGSGSSLPGANAFCTSHGIDIANITDYYFYQLYDYIKNTCNKRMIVWNDGNYLGTSFNSNFAGTNGASYNTHYEIISQIWRINGGAVGLDGYLMSAEDYTPNNLHSGTSSLIAGQCSVIQSTWKPRLYSSMRAMYDWGVGTGLNTRLIAPTSTTIIAANPVQISPYLLGSETFLWESKDIHDMKCMSLRYKAPLRCENTYSFGKNTTGLTTMSSAFDYLDNRFTNVTTGVRIVESGLTETIGYKFRTSTDNVQIPYATFANALRLTLITQNTAVSKIYYTLNSTLIKQPNSASYPTNSSLSSYTGVYPFADLEVRAIDTAHATRYTGPITVNRYDSRINNSFLVFRAQCYDSSNNPIGPMIERRYTCSPYTLKMAGALTSTLFNNKFGNSTDLSYIFFNGRMTIRASNISPDGFIKCIANGTEYVLDDTNQLNITSSTNMISVGFFDSNNISVGKSTSFYSRSITDLGGELVGGSNPLNIISLTPKATFSITNYYTTSTSVQISSLLSAITNYPGGVKVTCVVVGGGGSGGARTITGSGVGAPGGGGGGYATEIYYNVSVFYTLTIEIGLAGGQSSVAFSNTCLMNLQDRDINMAKNTGTGVNKNQDPFYPIIAYPGTDGVGGTNIAGTRGLITKGDVIPATDATIAGSGYHGSGGRGYIYNGSEYGNGGNGSSNTIFGSAGIVIITLEPI